MPGCHEVPEWLRFSGPHIFHLGNGLPDHRVYVPLQTVVLWCACLFMLPGHSSCIEINKLTFQFLTTIQELGIIAVLPPLPKYHFLLGPFLPLLTHFLSLIVQLHFLHLPLGNECRLLPFYPPP